MCLGMKTGGILTPHARGSGRGAASVRAQYVRAGGGGVVVEQTDINRTGATITIYPGRKSNLRPFVHIIEGNAAQGSRVEEDGRAAIVGRDEPKAAITHKARDRPVAPRSTQRPCGVSGPAPSPYTLWTNGYPRPCASSPSNATVASKGMVSAYALASLATTVLRSSSVSPMAI